MLSINLPIWKYYQYYKLFIKKAYQDYLIFSIIKVSLIYDLVTIPVTLSIIYNRYYFPSQVLQ